MRENAGYRIIVAVPMTKDTELVIGYKLTSLGDQYVCWFCSDQVNYYWGKYYHTYRNALGYLNERIDSYLKGGIF